MMEFHPQLLHCCLGIRDKELHIHRYSGKDSFLVLVVSLDDTPEDPLAGGSCLESSCYPTLNTYDTVRWIWSPNLTNKCGFRTQILQICDVSWRMGLIGEILPFEPFYLQNQQRLCNLP